MIACELRYDNWFLTGLALAHAAEQHRLANLPENIARASFLLQNNKIDRYLVKFEDCWAGHPANALS